MNELTNTFPTFPTFIWILTLALFGLVGTLFWSRFQKVEKKTDKMQENYQKEFQSVRDSIAQTDKSVIGTIACTEKKIIKEFGDLKLTISENYVHKADCPFIHKTSQEGV